MSVAEGSGSESLRRLHAEREAKARRVDIVLINHYQRFYVPDLLPPFFT